MSSEEENDQPTLEWLKQEKTRAKKALSGLKSQVKVVEKKELKELRLENLTKLQEKIEKTDERFQSAHDDLHTFYLKDIDEEKESKAYDDHIGEVSSLDSRISQLITKMNVSKLISSIGNHLKIMETHLSESSDNTLTNEVSEVEKLMKKLLDYASDPGADESIQSIYDGFFAKLVKLKMNLSTRKSASDHPTSRRGRKESRSSSTHSTRSSSPSASRSKKYRLPKISIPEFHGDILEWDAFWTRFRDTVHDNPDLTDSDRLTYLRAALKDERAARLAATQSGKKDDYQTIVRVLLDRYNMPRRVHRLHVRNLISYKVKAPTLNEVYDLQSTMEKSIAALKGLEQFDVESLITSILVNSLDEYLLEKWVDFTSEHKKVPKLEVFQNYLRSMIEKLSTKEENEKRIQVQASSKKPSVKPFKRASIHHLKAENKCLACEKETHPLFFCPAFKELTVDRRLALVKRNHLCNNCLAYGHSNRSCFSKYTCKKCGRRHHSLLHDDSRGEATVTRSQPQAETSSSGTSGNTGAPSGTANTVGPCNRQMQSALLMTAQVTVRAPNGRQTAVRALLDQAATVNLISRRVVNQLNLPKVSVTMNLTGVQDVHTKPSDSIADFVLVPPESGIAPIHLQAGVVDKVTQDLPQHYIKEAEQWPLTEGIQLADPCFHKPGRVDLLLGVDAYNEIVLGETRRGKPDGIKLYKTLFGWVLAGSCGKPTLLANVHLTFHEAVAEPSTDKLLRSFWELEEVTSSNDLMYTAEEQQALEHFQANCYKTLEGRYCVALPKKTTDLELGQSREQALRRLTSTEKVLTKKEAWKEFQEAVKEYFVLDHAEVVPDSELQRPETEVYYLPMHGVLKPDSTTTRLRVVFDASTPTSSGVALNDILLSGPNVYPALTDIILRFRSHLIGISADISKMFRAVELQSEDRDLHRFLWKFEPTGEVKDCRMKRLTFGITSSPFLATKALLKTAEDNESDFPAAAQVVRSQFYVDDCLTGADSIGEAVQLRQQLNDLLDRGGFTLRKWRASSQEVLLQIPEELQEREKMQTLPTPASFQKARGIHWDTNSDCLHITTSSSQPTDTLTKRQLASAVARTFDVIGWFAPAVIVAKILLQRLWEAGIDWDEQVPDDIRSDWQTWQEELPSLQNKGIPRCYFKAGKMRHSVSLHGFSDASQAAYAAVVYIRIVYTDTSTSLVLVTSKTKVAPIKRLTIPRLELCAAQLLAKLITTVRTALNLDLADVYTWTDSTITLNWLDGNPKRLKTFVSNRVMEILQQIPSGHWRYVPTNSNPADCASRGLMPSELLKHDLWWSGPSWLKLSPEHWPEQPVTTHCSELETRNINTMLTVSSEDALLLNHYSSYDMIIRLVAWFFRFYDNVKTQDPSQRQLDSRLSTAEFKKAEVLMLKQSQMRSFRQDLEDLQQELTVSKKSFLRNLNPFVDREGVLRVGGRLSKSHYTFSQRHPVILHCADKLTHLLVKQLHINTQHSGPTTLMGELCSRFHVVGAKRLLRSTTRNCILCKRRQAKLATQMMGQLPPQRVTAGLAFNVVGIDFAGPILIKLGRVRKPVIVKCYVCVFVCFAVKATHLEPVTDLTSEAFMACLKRFVSRRGIPSAIFTDNGTNFVGAQRELLEIYGLLQKRETQDIIAHFCCSHHIEWNFSPEKAPHFGGIWEASVKSMKNHLKKIMGAHKFTLEELTTILTQIEATMNSRPLVPMETPPEDGIEVLTPAHFLVGRSLHALPDKTDIDNRIPLLQRWNLCRHMSKEFWKRWTKEYIHILNRFQKWTQPQRNFRPGDVVLIRDQEMFNCDWPLARVEQVYPGPDSKVRVVSVRTSKGLYRRPIAKLVLLLPEEDQDVPSSRGRMFRSRQGN